MEKVQRAGNRGVLEIRLMLTVMCFVWVCIPGSTVYAQEKPPHPFTIALQAASSLAFGIVYQTGAGTLVLSPTGATSTTGGVYRSSQGGNTSTPAVFLVTANSGTYLSIMVTGTTMTGSGGGTLSMSNFTTDVGSPFIVTTAAPSQMPIHIGATLNLAAPGANPPGTYSGSITVTIVQQ